MLPLINKSFKLSKNSKLTSFFSSIGYLLINSSSNSGSELLHVIYASSVSVPYIRTRLHALKLGL